MAEQTTTRRAPSALATVPPPLVSVIIPVYNRRDLACETIDSALAQDWPCLEIVVVDDGSTDDTAEGITTQYGDRVTLVRQANAGPSAARNRGFLASRGEFLVTIDSDDILPPGSVRARAELLLAHPAADVCIGLPAVGPVRRAGRADPGRLPFRDVPCSGRALVADYLRRPFFVHAELMFRCALLPPGGEMYDPDTRYLEDFLLVVRMLCLATFVACDAPTTRVRKVAGQNRRRYESQAVLDQGLAPVERFLGDPQIASRLGPLAGEVRAHFLMNLATAAWRVGDARLFRHYLARARSESQWRGRESKDRLRYLWSFLTPGRVRRRPAA